MDLQFLVPGGYTPWSNYNTCSATCGGGTHERSRTCANPRPQHGGATCEDQNLGPAKETSKCNTKPCPGKQFSDFPLRMACTLLDPAFALFCFLRGGVGA